MNQRRKKKLDDSFAAICRVLRGPSLVLLILDLVCILLCTPTAQNITWLNKLCSFVLRLFFSDSFLSWMQTHPLFLKLLAAIPFALVIFCAVGPKIFHQLVKNGARADKLPSGLRPELAQSAETRMEELRSSCPDAFPAEIGIRVQNVYNNESRIVPNRQDYVVRWNANNEILIDGVIEGRIHVVLEGNVAKFDSNLGMVPLTQNKPHAIIRRNRNGDIVAKCYITWLGGK